MFAKWLVQRLRYFFNLVHKLFDVGEIFMLVLVEVERVEVRSRYSIPIPLYFSKVHLHVYLLTYSLKINIKGLSRLTRFFVQSVLFKHLHNFPDLRRVRIIRSLLRIDRRLLNLWLFLSFCVDMRFFRF